MKTTTPRAPWRLCPGEAICAASLSQRLLASVGADGSISLWDTRTGEERRRLNARSRLRALALSPDGGRVAGGAKNVAI